MTLNELRALADEFFEWPIAHNKSTVTMTSALLFAQHVLEKHGNAQAAENSAGVDALRAALAEMERDWSLLEATQESLREHMAEIQRLRAALAQPEQEPAAWMVYTQDGASAYVTDNQADIGEDQRALPLYTAPHVRHPLAQLKGGGNLPPPLQGSTVAETATTQQPVEQTPPSEYRRGYWDGFAIGKREGRIEADDALRADAERLAWLDKFALSVDMVADPDNLVQVWHSTTRPPYSTTGSTLREAIDAAIKSVEEGK